MRDFETLAAVKAKWDVTTAITALAVGGLLEPPVPERDDAEQRRPKLPYATATCGPTTGPVVQRGPGGEIDYRLVTFVVYASTKADVAAVGIAVNTAFANQPLDIANADWMRTEPMPDNYGGKIERADKVNEGETWKATLTYRVWTSRPKNV